MKRICYKTTINIYLLNKFLFVVSIQLNASEAIKENTKMILEGLEKHFLSNITSTLKIFFESLIKVTRYNRMKGVGVG